MSVTSVRKRSIAVLVIGASGKNVLRVMTPFERQSLVVARADDLANAVDSIVRDLPYVVLSLIESEAPGEGKKLTAISNATGAALIRLDPNADDATFKRVLDEAVHVALEKSGKTPVSAASTDNAPSAPPPPPKEIDDGWDKS